MRHENPHAFVRAVADGYPAQYEPAGIVISIELARRQHEGYVQALRAAGAIVRVLPPEEPLPDSVFVEDTVVIWRNHALVTRPPTHRSGEEQIMADCLTDHVASFAPVGAALEGGDVLQTDRHVFVGLSARTNDAGADAVARFMHKFHRPTIAAPVTRCLHLKTGATYLGDNAIAIDPGQVDPAIFDGLNYELVEVEQASAANCIRLNEALIVPFRKERIPNSLRLFAQSRDLDLFGVDISEFEKGDAGLTCMSVIWSAA